VDPTPPIADEVAPEEEEPLLRGPAVRLAWMTAGTGVVLIVGSVAPPWFGLVVLAVWFVPLLCHAGLRQFLVLLTLALVGFAGFGALNWRVVGLIAITLLEECLLVVTVALLGGWLL
jgi:hypothetical protein